MSAATQIAAKERRALLRDQRGLGWLLVYSLVLSAFALLLISNQELSLLDNAQAVYMLAGTVAAAGAVIAAILGRTPSPASASAAPWYRCSRPRSGPRTS
jgi:hypothetical protein